MCFGIRGVIFYTNSIIYSLYMSSFLFYTRGRVYRFTQTIENYEATLISVPRQQPYYKHDLIPCRRRLELLRIKRANVVSVSAHRHHRRRKTGASPCERRRDVVRTVVRRAQVRAPPEPRGAARSGGTRRREGVGIFSAHLAVQ